MDATTTQNKVENWFQGFNPSVKATIDTLGTITEARDEKNRYLTGPRSFRIATPAFPPALLVVRDHALEIVWEESSPVKLLFNIFVALDLPDTHIESLVTNQIRKNLTGPEDLAQFIGGVQFADTGFHSTKGQTRL